MSESEYREILRLLEDAAALLQSGRQRSPTELLEEIRRLSLELDLLKLRIGQAPADSQRN